MKTITAFLSHNHEDKEIIEQVGIKLRKEGITPWLDKWNLIPGDPWQEAIEEALDSCNTCIVFFGNNGVGPWQNEEMRIAIQRRVEDKQRSFRVIPVILPGAQKTSNIPLFLKRATWVEFDDNINDEKTFSLLLNGIKGSQPYPIKSKPLDIKKYKKDVSHIYKLLGGKIVDTQYCNDTNFSVSFQKGPFRFLVHVLLFLTHENEQLKEKDMQSIFIKWSDYNSTLNADKTIVVSNTDITSNAKNFASSKKIEAIKFEDLLNQLVDFNDYITNSIDVFESTELFKFYIDQTGSDVEDYETIQLSSFDIYLHKPLVNYFNELLFEEKKKRVALLGNFGVGKTVFCKYYHYYLLNEYKKDKSNRIPVYLNLKEFRSGLDIHQVLLNQLQKQPGIELSYELFLELQRLGRFIFILDSLDEMATKVDRIVINENLRELDRLLQDGDNIYIISCRTHFFHEKITENVLEDYEVVFLTEWGRDELESYFKLKFPKIWKAQLNKFDSIKGLDELSRTPMFLEMIIKSIPDIHDDDDINLTNLYHTYTNDWINQQSKRRGSVMSASQRRNFTKTLAVNLYCEDESELHFSKLHEIAQEISGYKDATRVDYFDTDARTSTFLTKTSDGLYGFRHRSFLEFFSSIAIVEAINSGNDKILSKRALPKENLLFLENIDINNNGINNLHKWSLEFKTKYLSRNSISLLKLKSEELNPEVIKYYKIESSEWELFDNSRTDDRALEQIYERYYEELLRMGKSYAKTYNVNTYDIEDSVQELLLRLWTDRDKTRLEKFSVKSYLHVSLRNIILQRYRLKNRQIDISLDSEYTFDNIVEESSLKNNFDQENDLVTRVIELIDGLDDNSRIILRYTYLENLSIKEIAKKMKMKEPFIRQKKYRAMKMLRELSVNDHVVKDLLNI
ncbi:sigma-70 family RNA polymerase sigma factor [Prolixibacteraceae bacterium JC049]|nr:sigma-70 family RNA polymerase sigma factor [Prolixibacteraceae bacterium JC049]